MRVSSGSNRPFRWSERLGRCLVALSTNMLGDYVPQQTGLVEQGNFEMKKADKPSGASTALAQLLPIVVP
jgi:hypothetical protein